MTTATVRPGVDTRPWPERAACRTVNPDAFYVDGSQRGAGARRSEEAARTVCRRCPVAAECLAEALDLDDGHGVRGALTAAERARIGTATPAEQAANRLPFDTVRAAHRDNLPLTDAARNAGIPTGHAYRATYVMARAPWLIRHVINGLPLAAAYNAAGGKP